MSLGVATSSVQLIKDPRFKTGHRRNPVEFAKPRAGYKFIPPRFVLTQQRNVVQSQANLEHIYITLP